VLIRVRWSRWLALQGPGGCLVETPDGWTGLRADAPGRYALGGSLSAGPTC
jgi:hypothetical protein